MANYSDESSLKKLASFTPEEQLASAAYERSPANLRELDAAIRGESRPDVKALLVAERTKQGGPMTDMVEMSNAPDRSSSSARVSWKEPGMAAGDAKVMLQRLNGEQAAAMQALQAAVTGGQAATDAIIEGERKLGPSKSAAITASGQIDVAKTMQQTAIRDVFHASIVDPDSKIVDAQRQRDEAQNTMDSLRAKINEEDQVMPWDDPLRWVVNQFTLPTMKLAFNAAHGKEREMVRRISDTQARVSAQLQIDSAPVLDQLKAKAAAEANTAMIESSIQVARAQGAQQSIIAQGIMQKMNIGQQGFSNNMEVARLFAQSYSIGEGDRQDSAMLPSLQATNVKRAAAGLQPYTMPEFKQLSTAEKTRLTTNAKVASSFGTDAGDSYTWLQENGALNTIAEKNPTVYNFYAGLIGSPEYKKAEAAVSANPKFMNLGPDEKRAATLTLLQQTQTTEIGNKIHNNSNNNLPDSNPYKFKPLNAITYPELKDNIFTSIAADVSANTPGGKVDDKAMMLRLLAKAEAEPKMAAAYAKQFSDYYRIGTKLQWERSGAKVIGYPPPVGYGISGVLTEVTGIATQTWTPSAVEHWLIKNMQERRQAGLGMSTLGMSRDEFNKRTLPENTP